VVVLYAAVRGFWGMRHDGGATVVGIHIFTLLQDAPVLACMQTNMLQETPPLCSVPGWQSCRWDCGCTLCLRRALSGVRDNGVAAAVGVQVFTLLQDPPVLACMRSNMLQETPPLCSVPGWQFCSCYCGRTLCRHRGLLGHAS
jgi:hypothetical protein